MKQVRQAIASYFKRADWALLLFALLVAGFGLVVIYGASRPLEDPDRYMKIQTLGIALGSVGFVLASLLDLRRFPKLWIVFFFLNIAFQLSLQFFGKADNTGNKSWIPLVAGINIQPGEVGKMIFIYTLGSHMNALRDKLNHPFSIIQLAAHMGLTTVAVFVISKDMGVALTYPIIFLVMLFAGGVNLLWLLAGTGAAGLLAWPLWNSMSVLQQERILVVFDPTISAAMAWHADQSIDAIQRGGMYGVGLLGGKHFVNNHNDFIFSTTCERFGFVGGALLIALLTLLVFRIFYGAVRSDDLFGKVLCMGVAGMFMFQILINIGMCLRIMPVIGLTLPLVSYGGSSVMTTIASLGFVAGVRMYRKPQWIRNTE